MSWLHAAKASAEEVLHPPASTEVLDEPDDIMRAGRAGRLIALPSSLSTRFVSVDERMGELARRLGQRPVTYLALRPEALAVLAYLGIGVEAISGDRPLVVPGHERDRMGS